MLKRGVDATDQRGKGSVMTRLTPRRRVMMDLSVATDGYAGIPHDARLIFSMLSDSDNLGLSGLIYPLAHTAPFRLRPGNHVYAGRIAAALHIASYGYHRPAARHPLLRLTNLAREVLHEGLGACKAGRSACKI